MTGLSRSRADSSIALYLLLAAFVLLGTIYSIVTPIFEASDELWHYPMVKTLADGNGLPIQNSAQPGPWRQEGSQPPLYYALGAIATAWINTSDMGQVRRLNPHADNGIITEDGNNNIVVHNAVRESFPWSGTVLAVHVVRFLSVLMGAGTVYFTYRIGEEIFDHAYWLAYAGAAAVAFTPMFVFISGSVNNDNLGVLTSTLALWVILRLIRAFHSAQSIVVWTLALSIVIGLAALSKQSTLGLFLIAGLSFMYVAWRQRRVQTLIYAGGALLLIVTTIAGWWYYRNWTLYKDPTGLNTFLDIVGRRSPPASLLQLWGERVGFVESYWGLFGGVSLPMAEWAYAVLNGLAALSVVGVALILWRKWVHDGLDIARWIGPGLTLLWIPAVVLPLVLGWTRYTLASQGRLIFSAIGPLSLWFMTGLGGWSPVRWGKIITGAACAVMGLITVLAPFLWIYPRYEVRVLQDRPAAPVSLDFTPASASTPAMRLTGYAVDRKSAHPGDVVHLTLSWDTLAPMVRNWSVFVHLQDSADIIVAQRDTYPGLGLLATRDLRPGYHWVDTYAIPISRLAYSPETLRVIVGVYDLETGQRMAVENGLDSETLGTVSLEPNIGVGNIANPIDYSFGDAVRLVGYSIEPRRVRAGGTLGMHLYWRAARTPVQDYTLSIQLFDEQGQKRGQVDQPLLDKNATTRKWIPGKTADTAWHVALEPDTPPGACTIRLVVYWFDQSGQPARLQVVTPAGEITDPFLDLAKVQVAR
jgi:4-amino-4-deoxy-L-arabinose transferase-like glycosyltransferase